MGAGATYKGVASGEVDIVVGVVPGIINAPGVELPVHSRRNCRPMSVSRQA